jgi:hypothetical protein
MTSLLDMVKETDLRLGFTDVLKSPTAYEVLERSVLQPRLLLCLHGIGTNAGLQRMAGLESGVTAKDLAYVRRRYIRLNSNKGTKRDMAISLIPFDRLDFRTLGYSQNGAPFSPPILGVEFRCCLAASRPRSHTRRAG